MTSDGQINDGYRADALEAVELLGEALAQVGISLPDLQVDPSLSHSPLRLVELGSVRPQTAERLARVVRSAQLSEKVAVVNRRSRGEM